MTGHRRELCRSPPPDVANKILSNDFRSRLLDGPQIGMDAERAERLRQQELIRKVEAFEQTEAARSGFMRRFEREAHPERVLGEEERCDRAVAMRREYMRKLTAKSVRARRERALRLGVGRARRGGGTERVPGCDANRDIPGPAPRPSP